MEIFPNLIFLKFLPVAAPFFPLQQIIGQFFGPDLGVFA